MKREFSIYDLLSQGAFLYVLLYYSDDISDDGLELLSIFSYLQLRELDSCSLQPWLRFNYILVNVKTEAGYVMAYSLALFTK